MKGGPKDKKIIIEQVNLMLRHTPSMIFMNLFVAAIITLIMLIYMPPILPLSWFMSILAICGLRLFHNFYLQSHEVTKENVNIQALFLVTFSLIIGIMWGCLAFILPIDSEILMLVLASILLSGMVAGSISFLSIYKPAYFVFAISCVAPLAFRCITSGDEIQVLSGSLVLALLFVNLFHSHLSQINILKAINLGLENKDLIRRLEIEKDNAEESRKTAEHNNKAKSRFLASASHDLRQPLHAMGFFVEALVNENEIGKIKSLAQNINKTSHSLRNLLSSLLNLSKIESGALVPEMTTFRLDDLLEELRRDYTEIAQNKGLDLKIEQCDDVITSDRQMLGRILTNLLSNAIRYTELGFVRLHSEEEGGQIRISVSDSGLGISDDKKEDIFREFYQIGNKGQEEVKGLGLGLSIVDGLCKILHHELHLDSEFGIGSSFSIFVPIGKEQDILPEEQDIRVWNDDKKVNIMLVDGMDRSRKAMADLIARWGHNVFEASRLDEGIEAVENSDFKPDVLITDIQKTNSLDIFQSVQKLQDRLGRDVPAILVTGDTDKAISNDARKHGFTLLHKPVQPSKLRSLISYCINH